MLNKGVKLLSFNLKNISTEVAENVEYFNSYSILKSEKDGTSIKSAYVVSVIDG